MAVDDNCKVEYAQIKIQHLNHDTEVDKPLEPEELKEDCNGANAGESTTMHHVLLFYLIFSR